MMNHLAAANCGDDDLRCVLMPCDDLAGMVLLGIKPLVSERASAGGRHPNPVIGT
jgi:hypothetical protein